MFNCLKCSTSTKTLRQRETIKVEYLKSLNIQKLLLLLSSLLMNGQLDLRADYYHSLKAKTVARTKAQRKSLCGLYSQTLAFQRHE